MERACYISRPEQLPRLGKECDRIYFGAEFCERLIPSPDDLRRVAAAARNRAAGLTLVTPYVTDAGLSALETLLETARGLDCLDEVVFNDWGVLSLLREEKGRFRLALGRLLTKQKRGPRILMMEPRVPAEMLAHFRRMSADSERFSSFLRAEGVDRIELDNLLQGIERTGDLAASLHIPYAYVSTTRYCLTAYAGGASPYFRTIGPCARQCRQYAFELNHAGMPVTLLLKGNTYFYENRVLPPDPAGLGIDRLVEAAALPL